MIRQKKLIIMSSEALTDFFFVFKVEKHGRVRKTNAKLRALLGQELALQQTSAAGYNLRET